MSKMVKMSECRRIEHRLIERRRAVFLTTEIGSNLTTGLVRAWFCTLMTI